MRLTRIDCRARCDQRHCHTAHFNKGNRAGRSGCAGAVTLAILVIALPASNVRAGAPNDDFVPFVIPAQLDPDAPFASARQPIATDAPRIEAIGGHFVRNGLRVRIWGVNLSFGANFPTHEQATQIADRLAALGINSVRLHHMDTLSWPSGIWDPNGGSSIYLPALERLDYFIDQLAQRGIWTNLNLHVGRSHSAHLGLPTPGTSYDKLVNLFTPELIDAQKNFAAAMFSRVNLYRNVRYADDPAIAFVEITNENSLFMWDVDQSLRALPTFYASVLQQRYNAWLRARYATRSSLEHVWASDAEPLGEPMLTNGDFDRVDGGGHPSGWTLEQHGASAASAQGAQYLGKRCVLLDVINDDGTDWHLQINQPGLPLDEGRFYTLTFEAAATSPRALATSVMQAHAPWRNLGLGRQAELTPQWQTFRFGFFAQASDLNARVNFAFGGDAGSVYLANVDLRPGGQEGLLPDEDPLADTVELFVDQPTEVRERDRLRFLTRTEERYFDEMRDYIKVTLNCDALVTGTIAFGPLGVYAQRNMDFIDAHAYWQHPTFPGVPWDPNNWIVNQVAMTDQPAGSTLTELAAARLKGKPFTVSEYNHPAPLDYQAETIPMIAAFAAIQDWDGVWTYSYAHDADLDDDGYFASFFDIANNPAKLGFLPAGAAIFERGAVAPLDTGRVVTLASSFDPLDDLVGRRLTHGDRLWPAVQQQGDFIADDLLTARLEVALSSDTPATPDISVAADVLEAASAVQRAGDPASLDPTTVVSWDVASGRGTFVVQSAGAWAITGWANEINAATEMIQVVSPEFVAATLTSLDASNFADSRSLLVTALGRCENTNMGFSADRRTVGTTWGEAPVEIEAVDARLRLPVGRWITYPLSPDGARSDAIPVDYAAGFGELTIDPTHATIWYLLERAVGDHNRDGRVDRLDAEVLLSCMTGPGRAIDAPCELLDLSGDNDVDLADVSRFQSTLEGG